jgi:hypothetical protein
MMEQEEILMKYGDPTLVTLRLPADQTQLTLVRCPRVATANGFR